MRLLGGTYPTLLHIGFSSAYEPVKAVLLMRQCFVLLNLLLTTVLS